MVVPMVIGILVLLVLAVALTVYMKKKISTQLNITEAHFAKALSDLDAALRGDHAPSP